MALVALKAYFIKIHLACTYLLYHGYHYMALDQKSQFEGIDYLSHMRKSPINP